MNNDNRIANSIVNRPKPVMPDRLMTLWDIIYFYSDLACWKADKAEALMSGVYED